VPKADEDSGSTLSTKDSPAIGIVWSHKCCCDSNCQTKKPSRRGLGGSFLDHAAAFFFLSAQRFFMARPILLRAAADRCRLRP
jgi:hypothetical protein